MGWALAASLLLHVCILGRASIGIVQTVVPVPARTLEARLESDRVRAAPIEAPSILTHTSDDDGTARPPAGQHDPRRTGPSAEEQASAAPVTGARKPIAHELQRPAPAVNDPVYYAAHELDSYPAPLVPLSIQYPAHLAGAGVGGNVLVNLLVDEAGAVNRVAVLASEPPGAFDEHARTTLASVRFVPGRREGRPVKSRVTVRVNFDPASMEKGVTR